MVGSGVDLARFDYNAGRFLREGEHVSKKVRKVFRIFIRYLLLARFPKAIRKVFVGGNRDVSFPRGVIGGVR